MDGCPAARLVCSGLRLGLALADSQDLDDGVDGELQGILGRLIWQAVRRCIGVLGLRCDG